MWHKNVSTECEGHWSKHCLRWADACAYDHTWPLTTAGQNSSWWKTVDSIFGESVLIEDVSVQTYTCQNLLDRSYCELAGIVSVEASWIRSVVQDGTLGSFAFERNTGQHIGPRVSVPAVAMNKCGQTKWHSWTCWAYSSLPKDHILGQPIC